MSRRALVVEFLHADAAAGSAASPGLREEGAAMLAAAVRDLARGGLTVTVPIASGLPGLPMQGERFRSVAVEPETPLQDALPELVRQSDVVLVIAPESGGVLRDLVAVADESAGDECLLLNFSPSGCELFSDKLRTARWLAESRFPTPPTCGCAPPFTESQADTGASATGAARNDLYEYIIKPRDGVGSEHVRLLPATRRLRQMLDRSVLSQSHTAEESAWILQQRLFGDSYSIGIISPDRGQRVVVLPAVRQQVTAECGELRYRGGSLPVPDAVSATMWQVAHHFCRTYTDWRGYVGIDAVCHTETGQLLGIVDVNPRLCTSFVGYRCYADVVDGGSLLLGEVNLSLAGKPPIRFTSSGDVHFGLRVG